MIKKSFVALMFLLLPFMGTQQPSGLAQTPSFGLQLTCPTLPMVVDNLVSAHISHGRIADDLVKRVAKTYSEGIDPTKALLTEKEFKALEKRLFNLAHAARKNECDDFASLRADQIAWQKEMEAFVRKEVSSEKLTIDKTITLELDPEKRPRPKTKKEQAELRRALIQFQLANYVAADTKLPEAKKKLLHRYELATRRVKEQKEEDLFRIFLNAYATALDPHSTYFSPDDLEDFKIQMELSLTGIGAVLSSEDGYTIVQEIVPGGAADQHGKLQPKDKIIAVAQEKGEPVDVVDMALRDVVKLIRGKKDTKVTLTVLRQAAETERLRFTIVRDQIDLKEQAASLEWRNVKRGDKTLKLAILNLPSFYKGDGPGARDSAVDVKNLVAEAQKKKADGLLLDLSRNGGGVLQSAVAISGLFIERGAVVGVGDENKDSRPQILEDDDAQVQWDGPLVVLTSKASASASEILAGALKDYRRAIIVGDEHTYGKGTVQQLNQLPPGLGLLKVTTAMFFLPGGSSTQRVGVTSDIVIPSIFSSLDIGERYQTYALGPLKVKRFLDAKANASKKWDPIGDKAIARLAKLSQQRVTKDGEFVELKKKLAEAEKNDTRMTIAQIFENGEKDEEVEETEEDKKKLSIQAREATEILADLVAAKK